VERHEISGLCHSIHPATHHARQGSPVEKLRRLRTGKAISLIFQQISVRDTQRLRKPALALLGHFTSKSALRVPAPSLDGGKNIHLVSMSTGASAMLVSRQEIVVAVMIGSSLLVACSKALLSSIDSAVANPRWVGTSHASKVVSSYFAFKLWSTVANDEACSSFFSPSNIGP
jgi:hypothetical protein